MLQLQLQLVPTPKGEGEIVLHHGGRVSPHTSPLSVITVLLLWPPPRPILSLLLSDLLAVHLLSRLLSKFTFGCM